MVRAIAEQYGKFLQRIQGARFGRTIFSPVFLTWHYLWRFIGSSAEYYAGNVLDLGCGSKPYRDIVTKNARYIGLDYPGAADEPRRAWKPEIFGDGMRLPFRKESIDCVINTQVLEYIAEPASFIHEIAEVLRMDGVLIISAPLTYPVHHTTHDFFRFTESGLRYLLAKNGLEVISVKPNGAFWVVMGQLFLYFFNFRLFYRAKHDALWYVLSMFRIIFTPVIMILNVFINIFALLLNIIYRDPFITLNYSLVAQKRRTA